MLADSQPVDRLLYRAVDNAGAAKPRFSEHDPLVSIRSRSGTKTVDVLQTPWIDAIAGGYKPAGDGATHQSEDETAAATIERVRLETAIDDEIGSTVLGQSQ